MLENFKSIELLEPLKFKITFWKCFLTHPVFENFPNMCLEIYELDPARFLTAPGLVW